MAHRVAGGCPFRHPPLAEEPIAVARRRSAPTPAINPPAFIPSGGVPVARIAYNPE